MIAVPAGMMTIGGTGIGTTIAVAACAMMFVQDVMHASSFVVAILSFGSSAVIVSRRRLALIQPYACLIAFSRSPVRLRVRRHLRELGLLRRPNNAGSRR